MWAQWIHEKRFHYSLIGIALPIFIGAPHTIYCPRSSRLMLLITIFAIPGLLLSILWSTFLIRYITASIDGIQIQTTMQIIEDDYDLYGTEFGKMIISEKSEVSVQYLLHNILCLNHFSSVLVFKKNDRRLQIMRKLRNMSRKTEIRSKR